MIEYYLELKWSLQTNDRVLFRAEMVLKYYYTVMLRKNDYCVTL